MRAFLDFEASSLAKQSYPIEVAWVFEDGGHEAYLIRPAPGWTDWDARAEAIHHIPRDTLDRDGTDHRRVAERMIAALAGHDLRASAPSWDGKWLSTLLRAASLPRHALRLGDTDDACLRTAEEILAPVLSGEPRAAAAQRLLAEARQAVADTVPTHRALDDAQRERRRWLDVRARAEALASQLRGGGMA